MRSNRLKEVVKRVARGAEYHGPDNTQNLRSTRRRKRTGQDVVSDIPIRTLSHQVNFGGSNNERVRPIVAWPSEFPIAMHSRGSKSQKNLLDQKINSGNVIVDYERNDDETSFTFDVANVYPDSQFSDLDADESTKVIALANNKNAEHAILLFINGSNVWSVGYGFSGSGSRKDERHAQNLRRKLNKAKKIPDGTKEALAHAFETLQGALYTSDFLLSNWEQEAHIIWVGSLNNEIKQRVLNYLSHVNSVELKSKGDYKRTGKLLMTNNTTLQVGGSFYTENASWISKDLKGRPKLNCLEWVKHILDVPLKCGLLGRPSSCNRITPEQWSLLIDADFLGDLDGGRNIDVLKNIQTSLLKTDPASLIGDTARMATNNPRATAACVGASCAVGAAFGPWGLSHRYKYWQYIRPFSLFRSRCRMWVRST